MQEINIDEIMQEIRAEIKEKGYKESDLSFQDIEIPKTDVVFLAEYNEGELENALHIANAYTRVDYYRPIEGNGIKAICKKIVRKLAKPIIYHLCVSQETFNSNTVKTLNQMNLYIQKLEARNKELETMLDERK